MQRSKDADHLAIYSDATYPVGPDASGRITYVHVPPVSPLTGAYNPFELTYHPSDSRALHVGRSHHSTSLHSDRRVSLLLYVSRRPEVLWL